MKSTSQQDTEARPLVMNQQMAALAEERASPSFPVREMTYLLDGGQDSTALKEKFMLELERDPLWRMDDIVQLTLPQIRERTMSKAKNIVHALANEPVNTFRRRMAVISIVDPGFWTRLGVHYGLFFGALQGQANSQQMAYWVSKGALALNGVIGCFCMTELGHGSNLQGLETTATFDEASDEFVIHSPTITATKWWIGGAAHSATHAAVYAQLIVRGKSHGVKIFIVPLRDPKDYSLHPGIKIGDIGKKMGRDGIDNGHVTFTYVRIPRFYMLMKHTKVLRDGTVVDPPLAQLSYGALIQGRVAMVADSANAAKKALTIALRYAAIRRQFKSSGNSKETKLLDYTIHQHRLLPLLAQTLAMHFASVRMDKMYESLMEQLETASHKDANMPNLLETLKETHATSAGLKAHCTWATLNIIEQCRQSLGGHGYSEYTELAPMLKNWAVQCTWEGDNTILTLQAGRYLVSSLRDARKGKKLSAGVAYLNELPGILTRKCTATAKVSDLLNADVLAEALNVAAAHAVQHAASMFEQGLEKCAKDVEAAYEHCAAARFAAAKVHCTAYLFSKFAEGVRDVQSSNNKFSDALARPLENLLLLYGANAVTGDMAANLLHTGYFSPAHMAEFRSALDIQVRKVRRDAIPLVDSFNYSDYVINSPFGRYDGDIYTHYVNLVERLNPTLDPHPYFETRIKPLLTRSMSTEGEDAPDMGE